MLVQCQSCGRHFLPTKGSKTICPLCLSEDADISLDDEDAKECIEEVLHGNGCYTVKPVFYD